MQHIILEDFLNDMAVIRTTFETINLFPSDDPIAAEMQEMITEAQQNLIRGIAEICEALQANRAKFPFPLREFQYEMISAIVKGWNRNRLNNFMKIDAFDESDETLYYFDAMSEFDREWAETLSAQEFALLVFHQLLAHIRKPEHYTNQKVFEKAVFQRFLFVLFVSYCVKLRPFGNPELW